MPNTTIMNENQAPAASAGSPDPAPGKPWRRGRLTPTKEAPFAWQAKAALRAITRGERVANRCHTLAVYTVLSMLVSDRQADTVTCTKGYLASIAGIGPRSVTQALLDLEALGLVQVERQKVPGTKANAVNTYRLTSCTRCTTSCTGSASSRARNKNNKEGDKGAPSLLGIKENTPRAADAASVCTPASQPGAPDRGAPAFVMTGLDD